MTALTWHEPALTLTFGGGTESSVQARDAMLTERVQRPELPTFDDVVAAFPQFADAVCVFAAGSVVMGWGHGTSDIDLYVIMPRLPEQRDDFFVQTASTTDPTIYVVLGQFGAFRADIEVWTTDQLEELVHRFDERATNVHAVGRSEQDLFFRLVSGRALHGSRWWSNTRAAILTSGYKTWLGRQRRELAAAQLRRLDVMRAEKNSSGALTAARESFLCALEALLVFSDDFSVNRKWIFKRVMQERHGVITPEDATRLLAMPDSLSEPDRLVAELADRSRTIDAAVQEWMRS